ncbi:olfactory receptor 52P1-like [Emydura macquarii macquarii]|uniref:olfactory receptor 52P1-like n=1 Tax=Emydura macquarii macquarii TaxID=1129001 RepID=UPI003529F64B
MPKALCIFRFHCKRITEDGCITQVFFFNTAMTMQSAVLVTMAFNRYVAICDPLRYATILTNARVAKLGTPATAFAAILCILHTYCEHMAVVKLSCGDTTVNRIYSLVITLVIIGSDLTLIGLSYGLIIRAILRISSKKSHGKALNTCTAHICVMLMSYTPVLFSSLTHRFGQSIDAHVHILLANLYVLVPPMFNPIVYGVKTKELRDNVGKYICRM